MKIGAHVSISKGLTAALDKVHDMGANCLQIFASPPRSFTPSHLSDQDCSAFKNKSQELDIGPNFIHATYLINLGSEKDQSRQLSVDSLKNDLMIADKIGAEGSIVHTGSHKGKGLLTVLPWVVDSIQKVLSDTPSNTNLYLEIASGGNGKIGITFEELQMIIDSVNNPRLGVYLDTAHMFAGGYAFDTEEKVEELYKKICDTVGWTRVGGFHANDSKVEFNSGKDRHENIGEGLIGKEPFRLLLNHAHFGRLPFVLETPGFDDNGPDKQNVDILKSLL